MQNERDDTKELLIEEQPKEEKKYTKKRAATILSIVSIVIAVFTVIGFLVLRQENVDKLVAFSREHIFVGSIIFLLICIAQVVVAFVPGELVEIAAGVIFGPWQGIFMCLLGLTLGSVIVIVLVRKFGVKLIETFYPSEKIDSLPILNDPKKRNFMIFILFLIPGTPKDFITYLIGLTKVSIPMYIILTTFARIPSIITSTFIGDAAGNGDFMLTVILVAITAVISGAGCLVYSIIQKKTGKKKAKKVKPVKNEDGEVKRKKRKKVRKFKRAKNTQKISKRRRRRQKR